MLKISITQVQPHGVGMALPQYMTDHASGMDLYAACQEKILLKAGERCLVPTGLSMAIPEGFEAQVRPRSGLALKHGITCLNTPGTIDADYRGEVGVILANLGKEDFIIQRGDRVAQLVVQKVEKIQWEICLELPSSKREGGGFGSTGK